MRNRNCFWILVCSTLWVLGLTFFTTEEQYVAKNDHPIVIVYENDVHCAVEGYAKFAAFRNEQLKKTPYVATVSCGDFIQGDVFGALSKGTYIIDIMNEVGYDVVTFGNHEFDFGLSHMFELMRRLKAPVVNCHFKDLSADQLPFPAYKIIRYGQVDVAFIGFTTISTLGSASKKFQDNSGRFIYDFSQNDFYRNAQYYVDEVRKKGADYVVALSHLGDREEDGSPTSLSLIAQTTGIDVVLDGHAHSCIPDTLVKDREGKPVLLSSTGSHFKRVGILTISNEGCHCRLESLETVAPNAKVQALVDRIQKHLESEVSNVLGKSEVALTIHDSNGVRVVRKQETNIGNFCADAFRIVLHADVALINGGGIRNSVQQGDVIFHHLLSVFPFGNFVMTATLTGQQLLDVLEYSVVNLPHEFSEFMQVSGMKFQVDVSVPSPVRFDSLNRFAGIIDAPRRVRQLLILNHEGEYEPVEVKRRYKLASIDYLLKEDGGKGILQCATPTDDKMIPDIEVLMMYLQTHLDGMVGSEYASSQGRIRIR